ncbi:unnamed protein product [Calypogeia fissa]
MKAMASFVVDNVAMASCSSLSSPFSAGQRLFPSGGASAEGDCSCSGSGWRSGRDRAPLRVRTVVCRLQFPSRNVSPLSSFSSSPFSSDEFVRRFPSGSMVKSLRQNWTSRDMEMEMGMGRRERGRGNGVVTMALPIDSYWITAAEAVAVAVLMAGFAVMAGIAINIKVEVDALREFHELEAKGMLPEIPEGEFDKNSPLFIFENKELFSSNAPSRNRPVREEFEPQLEAEMTELETATKELETVTQE